MKRGFTLIEMLTALAVVSLLAAIIFPVIARARHAGHRAESIAYLRQLGTAIEMYRADHDGRHAFRQLDPIVETGYLDAPQLLLSKTDAFEKGYGRTVADCIDVANPTSLETSYETLLFSEPFYDYVKSIDENAAIVVDRTHGDVLKEADVTCRRVHMYYVGTILRLYEDTSVQTRQFTLAANNAPSGVSLHWRRMRLYTDVEPPPVSNP